MPWLVRTLAFRDAEEHQLGDAPVVVGRGEHTDIRVDDREMSRRHFKVYAEAGQHVVEDLGSANGTWVNDLKVAKAILKPAQRIRAGQTIFVYKLSLNTIIGRIGEQTGDYRGKLNRLVDEADRKEGSF